MSERAEISKENLQFTNEDYEGFKNRLVTGDETWVYPYDPESKRQTMKWRQPHEPHPRKFKTSRSTKKIMVTVFWNAKGVIHIDYLQSQKTITGEYYAGLLHHLPRSIKEKRRGLISAGVLLLHDNASPHTSRLAKAALQECGFQKVPHPTYSPDLAPQRLLSVPRTERTSAWEPIQ